METADVLARLMQQVILGMHTYYPAKVLSFNIYDQTATIQPLFQTKEYGQSPKTQPIVEDVPVQFQRYQYRTEGGSWSQAFEYRTVLKVDDIVMCAVAQRSLDDADSRQPHYAGKARIMNLQDSVILGVLIPA